MHSQDKTAETFRHNPRYSVLWNGTEYIMWLDETTDDEIALIPASADWDTVTQDDITMISNDTFTDHLQDPDMPFTLEQ